MNYEVSGYYSICATTDINISNAKCQSIKASLSDVA